MITTYILGPDDLVWHSICDADGENDHAKDLAEAGREALAAHWGEGGGVRLDVSRFDAEPDAIVAVARSLDGRFCETVRVERAG